MREFATSFMAICVINGELTEYAGPIVMGINEEDAQAWCNENADYLRVIGESVGTLYLDLDEWADNNASLN